MTMPSGVDADGDATPATPATPGTPGSAATAAPRRAGPRAGERPDRDLVTALRAELAAVDPARPCCRNAELQGLGDAALGQAPSAAVARLAVRLERQGRVPGPAFDWETAASHCRIAYLRGLFLARGPLSLAAGRTHLEFVVPADDAPRLAERLSAAGLPASWRIRRSAGVVTWKSAERVISFLHRAGASSTVLELEARLVSRALRGELNRVINAESANVLRSVTAARRQIEAIETLDATGGLASQPAMIRAVAQLRRESPEATLGELAERLGASRSIVQRALERIASLATSAEAGQRATQTGEA